MKLLPGEKIIKVYHHHAIFFIWRAIKLWAASLPFFMLEIFFRPILPTSFFIISVLITLSGFALIQLYDSTLYYLDSLVITDRRLLHLDWINPFRFNETEALLTDIEDIETEENGFLAQFSWFDFGSFEVETSSTRTVICFDEAPDPEGIKFFITNLSRKHNDLLSDSIRNDQMEDENFVSASEKIENDSSKVASV